MPIRSKSMEDFLLLPTSLDLPVGLEWAVEVIHDATDEWLRFG